jgi:hypothetical protein
LLARLWPTFRDFSDDPDAFGEFGGPEMRRKLPLHRLYAIEERWQAGGTPTSPSLDDFLTRGSGRP